MANPPAPESSPALHPVLLLPGTLCTGAIFERQIKALESVAPSVNVVQFRHERSIEEMAATAAGFIPPGTAAAIAGFSMGGMVALALARQAPEKVDRLALINSNYHADRPERRARRLEQLAAVSEDGLPGLIEHHHLPNYLHHQDPAHRTLILDMAIQLGIDSFRAQTSALADRPDTSEVLRTLQCRVLILGSSDDQLCPPSVQIEMHRMSMQSDLVILGECGHFSTLERAEAVSRALRGWYQERPHSR